LLYCFGKKIKDPNLVALAVHFAKTEKFSLSYPEMRRCLNEIFLYDEIRNAEANLPYVRDSFFPEIQVMTARSAASSPKGFFIAAKGGTNGESHNHNDVGQFILYYNGKPVIVDAGKDTYKKITFSGKRYTLWFTQSGSHNLPIINSQMQQNGAKFRAENVRYQTDNEKVSFSLDIAKAYPAEANVIKWRRTIDFFRQRKIVISEDYILKNQTGDIEFNFLTPCSVEKISSGELLFVQSQGFSILLKYDPRELDFVPQKVHFDKKENRDLWESWGDSLTMVRLKGKSLPSIGKLRFEFSVYNE
ncbi:MAG: hypothetical protein GXO74_12870, partial [Calditrichaeota bacterium]|nr:hypothetical protein [Calditrichota bacterium]